MDDESSKSMEQVEEVPLKEFGETESEASIEAYLTTQITY